MLTILGTPSRSCSSSKYTTIPTIPTTYHTRHALESCSYCTFHTDLTDHTYHTTPGTPSRAAPIILTLLTIPTTYHTRHALEKLLTVSSTEPVMVLQPTKPGTYQARYGRDIGEV